MVKPVVFVQILFNYAYNYSGSANKNAFLTCMASPRFVTRGPTGEQILRPMQPN